MKACTPSKNLLIPRNHTQYGSLNGANALFKVSINRILYSKRLSLSQNNVHKIVISMTG